MRIKAEDRREIQGMKPVLEECWFLMGEVEHYTRDQMREVYSGVMGYHSERCIKLYSSHFLSPNQMHEIRCGVDDGLSYEELLAYSNPQLPWQVMRYIRNSIKTSRANGTRIENALEALQVLITERVCAAGLEEGE